MLDEIFVGKTVKKVNVIRDYAKSISYFTMDNECHANICVFVQNSPDPPPTTEYSRLAAHSLHCD